MLPVVVPCETAVALCRFPFHLWLRFGIYATGEKRILLFSNLVRICYAGRGACALWLLFWSFCACAWKGTPALKVMSRVNCDPLLLVGLSLIRRWRLQQADTHVLWTAPNSASLGGDLGGHLRSFPATTIVMGNSYFLLCGHRTDKWMGVIVTYLCCTD